MSPSSKSPAERARKYQGLYLQRVSGACAGIAAAIGCSEATLSRLKNEHLETFCLVLAHAGLKLVPVEYRCFPEKEVDAILSLARAHLRRANTVDDLFPDEERE
jgi:S-adenosylmethionine:tRNA-ribosyltransferase-isomerase (queuine synthetase)